MHCVQQKMIERGGGRVNIREDDSIISKYINILISNDTNNMPWNSGSSHIYRSILCRIKKHPPLMAEASLAGIHAMQGIVH